MKVNYEQGSQEWLSFRQTKLGASDAPIILGVSPYKTPYKLWQEKLGLAQDTPKTEAMRRGTQQEPYIRELVNKHFFADDESKFEPAVFVHDKIDYMMASLDGYHESELGKLAIEIKYANAADHEIAASGDVPGKYKPQLEHQLEVLGLNYIYYCSYNASASKELHVVRYDSNKALRKELLDAEKKFWKCLQELEAPALQKGDYVQMESKEWLEACAKYRYAQEQIATAESLKEEAKQEMIRLSDGKSVEGYGITLSHCVRKGNVDYAKIPQLKDVDLEVYRKPATSYVLIKEKNDR